MNEGHEVEYKPTIFLGASGEASREIGGLLDSLYRELKRWAKPTKWNDIFSPSSTTIESLMNKIPTFDLCVFIWNTDDTLTSRGREYKVARDNVVFETGIAFGAIGRENTFIVTINDVKLISDLGGVTYIPCMLAGGMSEVSCSIERAFKQRTSYVSSQKEQNLISRMCTLLRLISRYGPDDYIFEFNDIFYELSINTNFGARNSQLRDYYARYVREIKKIKKNGVDGTQTDELVNVLNDLWDYLCNLSSNEK